MEYKQHYFTYTRIRNDCDLFTSSDISPLLKVLWRSLFFSWLQCSLSYIYFIFLWFSYQLWTSHSVGILDEISSLEQAEHLGGHHICCIKRLMNTLEWTFVHKSKVIFRNPKVKYNLKHRTRTRQRYKIWFKVERMVKRPQNIW